MRPFGTLDRMAAQRRVVRTTAHRPWPLPDRPWLMAQTWERLLFAHWRLPPEALRRVLPPQVPIDVFDGSAWIGVTPFVVRTLRLRRAPPAPVGSTFPELNVRTYATVEGRPGIWFLSLDAASAAAVFAARRTYRLPYFRARMSAPEEDDGRTRFEHERRSGDGEPAAFAADYGPAGPVFQAEPGTLEHFLAERYCLYTLAADGRLLRGDIHHPPWALQPAGARIARNTMARPYGIDLGGEPLLHFAARQDVVFWHLGPAGAGG